MSEPTASPEIVVPDPARLEPTPAERALWADFGVR